MGLQEKIEKQVKRRSQTIELMREIFLGNVNHYSLSDKSVHQYVHVLYVIKPMRTLIEIFFLLLF